MLDDLSTALRRLLYEHGQIDAKEVDVAFDPPLKAWMASVTRPTLDLYLFDVHENTNLRQTNVQTTRGNGGGIHRMGPRRFDVSYLVSAVTSDVADEHLLLWRAMVTLLKFPTLPDDLVPPAAQPLGLPVATRVGSAEDGARALDIWSALDAPPRPSLFYTVTIPVDLEIELTAPLVLSRTLRYSSTKDTTTPVEQHTFPRVPLASKP